MDKMYSDVKKDLDNILYYGYYDAEAVDVITGTYFDEDAYVSALLSMRNPTEAEAYWLKSQFMYSTTEKNTKTVLKNKKIKLANFFTSSTSISRECPSWVEVIKYVGGYSELAKSGIKKNTYEDLFTLFHDYDLVTFVEKGKCVISSKYSGNDKAFDYHKINKEKSDKIIGEYFIEEINYDILSGKADPVVVVKAGDLSFSFNLYDLEPRTKFSLKKSFKNYDATINTMFDDLLMGTYEDLLEEKKRIAKEKKRLAEKKRNEEKLRKIEKIENLVDSIFNEQKKMYAQLIRLDINLVSTNVKLEKIKGVILDSNGKKLKGALVSLYSLKGKLIDQSFSYDNGYFSMASFNPKREYFIRIFHPEGGFLNAGLTAKPYRLLPKDKNENQICFTKSCYGYLLKKGPNMKIQLKNFDNGIAHLNVFLEAFYK